MSRSNYQTYICALPGLAQLREALAAADEAARPSFEDKMRSEGVADFARRPDGHYTNPILQWTWEDWRIFARAGIQP